MACVQFDEPVLTEVALSANQNKRTFMCAILATRSDPASELAYTVALFKRVVEGFGHLRRGLHVCRGSW